MSESDLKKLKFEEEFEGVCKVLSVVKSDGKIKVAALEIIVNLCKSAKNDTSFIPNVERLVKCLRPLLLHRVVYMRWCAVKTMKYLCRDPGFSPILWKYHCHYFLIKLFDIVKEKKPLMDLMKTLMKRKSDVMQIPVLLMKGLVSVAENPDDPFNLQSVELLRDTLQINPRIVARSNGIKTLVTLLLDVTRYSALSENIISSILSLMDDHQTRQYCRPHLELQPIIGPFCQLVGKDGALLVPQWEAGKRVICRMMKSWTGLIVLSQEDSAIKSLSDALLMNDSPKRIDIILDTFFSILASAAPEEFKDLLPKNKDENGSVPTQNWRRFSISTKRTPGGSGLPGSGPSANVSESITQVFFACTLAGLIKNGLVQVLHQMSETGGNIRAAKLFQVMLVLADKLLSSNVCLEMHDEFDNEYSDDMNQILQDGKQQVKKTLSTLNTFYFQSKTFFKHKTATYLRVENVKTKVDTAMDDLQFHAYVKATNILSDKSAYSKWDWNSISILIYGPLKLPLRLAEMINNKGTNKFCKRILGYFKPFKKGAFCELNIQEGMLFPDMACQFIENLLLTPEGIALIEKSNFIKQLAEILEIEMLPVPEAKKERVLSEIAVTRTLSREYFRIIGTFSRISPGVKLLDEGGIFEVLTRFIKNGKRSEIIQMVIQNMDYSLANPELNKFSRNLLKETLASKKNIRGMAILRLRMLIKESNRVELHQYCIELLYQQLAVYDEVSTLEIIEPVCKTPETLDYFISLKPSVDLLEKSVEGRDLLLRMLSREAGFVHLRDSGWITRNLKEWREKKNLEFANNIEMSLRKTMSEKKVRIIDLDPNAISEYIVAVGPHFYGEICRTNIGCQYMAKTGHIAEFLDDLDNSTDKVYKRALYWVIGLIGSSEEGYQLIDGDNIIKKFVGYAEKSACLSLRGLSMYILAQLSRSSLGRIQLAKLSWNTHVDSETNFSIAIPSNVDQLLSIPHYDFKGSYVECGVDDFTRSEKDLPIIQGDIENKILFQLARLANPVTETNALDEIKKLRSANIARFTAKEIICHIYYLLDKYRYAKKTRSILFALVQDTTAVDMNFDYLDQVYGTKQ